VQLQTVGWLFMAVLEQWLLPCWAAFRLCRYRTHFTVAIDTFYLFPPASSQGPLLLIWDWLHFSHQSTFISRRQNMSPSWAVWWLCGPIVFILAHYCLYRWTRYLQAFGNCSQWWTRHVPYPNNLVTFPLLFWLGGAHVA
jgi:hypothetical protein